MTTVKIKVNRRIHMVVVPVGNVFQIIAVGQTEDDEVEAEDLIDWIDNRATDCVGRQGNKILVHSLDEDRIAAIRECFSD